MSRPILSWVVVSLLGLSTGLSACSDTGANFSNTADSENRDGRMAVTGETEMPDAGSCLTDPSCCPNSSDPFCSSPGSLPTCRTETDCYVECGRCILRGCSPPPGICADVDVGAKDSSMPGNGSARDADRAIDADATSTEPDTSSPDVDPATSDTLPLDSGDAQRDSDSGACPSQSETLVEDACLQCGPGGGCANNGETCRSTCGPSSSCGSGLTCRSGVCRRICF